MGTGKRGDCGSRLRVGPTPLYVEGHAFSGRRKKKKKKVSEKLFGKGDRCRNALYKEGGVLMGEQKSSHT